MYQQDRSQPISQNLIPSNNVIVTKEVVEYPAVVTTHVVKEVVVDYPEENDFHYQQERTSYVKWVKNLSIVEILVSLSHVVLAGLLLSKDPRGWPIGNLLAAIAYLAHAILSFVWGTKQHKIVSVQSATLHPRAEDGITRSVFINGFCLAGLAFFLFVNFHAQFHSAVNYVNCNDGTNAEKDFVRAISIAQGAFVVVHFFFCLLTARATFRAIKMSNEAMSYVVYLGCTLLFIFSLCLTFSIQKIGLPYDNNYSALMTNFPVWILKGLFVLAVAFTVLSLMGYLVNQRRWRVGYFALAFLLLVGLVLLVHFTGYAYRQRGVVARYYGDEKSYYERLHNVHRDDIQAYGCPSKYVDGASSDSVKYDVWEDTETTTKQYLNPNCAGLLGDLYSDAYLSIANFALLSLLSATLVSIGCYFFWYVSWLNTPPHHKREFFWIGLMGAAAVVYIICMVVVTPHLILERPTPQAK